MDLLKNYVDSNDSDEGEVEKSSLTVSLAPQVTLEVAPKVNLEQAVGTTLKPRTKWNPAGDSHFFAMNDASFHREEHNFGRSEQYLDRETRLLQQPHPATARVNTPAVRTAEVQNGAPSRRSRKNDSPQPRPSSPKRARKEDKPEAPSSPARANPLPPAPVFLPKSQLFIRGDEDYLGRSWLDAPSDARTFEEIEEYTAFIPKRRTHEFARAHKDGASCVRFFPGYGHLLLSAGLDGVAKIWDVGEKRRCIRSYTGHVKGVRDLAFSQDGRSFLTASYDRTMKLWDTETGRVVSAFDCSGAIPYCVRFNPDEAHSNEFLAGCGDKNVLQLDVRDANNVVQTYDQHMGAVNSIAFIDDNRRFVSSADDKVLRVWEYGIPIVIKFISDPKMHSMPVVLPHPNRKWLACQTMNSTITVFSARDRFRLNSKKSFHGHSVSGYACGITFSPDGRFIASGDSKGRALFWDWRSSRMFRTLNAHNGVCSDVNWHPTKQSLVASCGADGCVSLWD